MDKLGIKEGKHIKNMITMLSQMSGSFCYIYIRDLDQELLYYIKDYNIFEGIVKVKGIDILPFIENRHLSTTINRNTLMTYIQDHPLTQKMSFKREDILSIVIEGN